MDEERRYYNELAERQRMLLRRDMDGEGEAPEPSATETPAKSVYEWIRRRSQ